jgi:hypothetical protein
MNVTRVREKAAIGEEGPGLRFHSLRMLPPYNLSSSATRPLVTLANFSATECWLKMCVLSVNASVQAGIYSETVLDTFTQPPPSNTTWIRHMLQPPWGIERGIDTAANLSFGLSKAVQDDWSPAASRPDLLPFTVIPGYAVTTDRHTGIVYCNIQSGVACVEGAMPRYIFNANYTARDCGSPNADTFACVMGGVAAALTRTFRNSGIIANGTDIGEAFLVGGQAETIATFVRVQWYWILLPGAVWLLGVTTWIVVVLQTRRLRLPTWRDNPLPLLFLHRERDDRSFEKGPAGGPLHEELLSADDYSIWAHEKVTDRINVQMGTAPSHFGGVMRLVRTETESPGLRS